MKDMLIGVFYGREIAWRWEDFMEEGGTELKYETYLDFQQGRSGEENILGEGNTLIRGLRMKEYYLNADWIVWVI